MQRIHQLTYSLILTVFLLVSVALTGCEKDIDIAIPSAKQKITVAGAQPQNSFLSVKIGRSRSLAETINYNDPNAFTLENALVQVFVNGNLRDTLRYNATTAMYTTNKTQVQPGSNYKFIISANNFTTAEAEATALLPVPIVSTVRRASNRVGNFGELQDELLITFRDIDVSKNYYRVIVEFANNNFGFACINSTDADLIQFENIDPLAGGSSDVCFNSGKLIMTDDNFNLQTKTLRLFIDREALRPVVGNNNRTIRARVLLQHIPKSYFEFIKTSTKADIDSENPFAEPLNVFSNVKNGYGLYVPFGQAIDSIR